ncbi:MAG: SGNH/GDSL hydrolase family protein [Solirubrobacteraceae bacterium]|nr:SGNH/GDSL hydrolase family protein [Solirubrobacteraceae bacterium]
MRRAAGLLVAAVLAIGAAPAHAAAGGYVALGDSFAAGGGLLPISTAAVGPTCFQSTRNYPKLVQRALKLPAFTDETCSGAQTRDMTARQILSWDDKTVENGPQFDALRADTALVTVGIGGNDIGFTTIVGDCLSALPTGTKCRNRYVRNGVDLVRARIVELRPKLTAVLAGIRARSPRALIVTVSAPRFLPPDPRRCWPVVPVASGDAPWLEGIQHELSRAIRETGDAFGAVHADVEAASLGHDACQRQVSRRWVEALPARAFNVFHPSYQGERGMADVVLRAVAAAP